MGMAVVFFFMHCTNAHTLDFSFSAFVLSEGNTDQEKEGGKKEKMV